MRYRIALHQSDIKDALREYLAVVDEQLRGEQEREVEVVL